MRRLTAALAVLVLAVSAGCGGDDAADTTAGGPAATGGEPAFTTLTDGEILVGSDIPYEPFEFGNPPDYDGFDVELMRAIADRLGVELVWRDAPFNPIFNNLRNNNYDAVISASTITPERQQIVAFSDPYFEANQSILVRADTTDISSEADLEGLTLGAQQGTTGEAKAKEIPGATVRSYPGVNQAFNALLTEQVDAVVNDLAVSADFASQNDAVRIAGEIQTGEQYGIAVSKDNPELLAAINDALAELSEDGTYDDIYEKYFGQTPQGD
jgi:ABC-type amino acid transport substrate-binding protein